MATTEHGSLAAAKRAHQAGDLKGAEPLYREVLAAEPENAEAWYLLALVCQSTSRPDEALACYQRALAARPDHAEAHNSLGILLARLGKPEEAAASFEKALAIRPDMAPAHNNLGNVLKEMLRTEPALEAYRHAVRLKPDFAEAHNNLGNLLREQGQFAEAATCCQEAARLRPTFADAHNNLGGALAGLGKLNEAIPCYREALRLRPDFVEALTNLGAALAEQRKPEEAEPYLRQAVQLRPASAEGHLTLGGIFRDLLRDEESLKHCEEALRLRPDSPVAHTSLGLTLSELGRFEETLAHYDKAIALRPGHVNAHLNRSLIWLVQGRYPEAWAEYEWRWQTKELPARPFPQPQWDGSPLDGRKILLHAEQGLGDTIQFVRYAPIVKQAGGTVILVCQKPLKRLLARCAGIDQLVAQDEPLPRFDVHAPLLSLPRILGTTLDNIPCDVPYLSADPELVAFWKRELDALDGSCLKIGIGWRGSPGYRRDRQRSIPLGQFAPLMKLPGVRFFNLQKGPGAEELRQAPSDWPIVDLDRRLDERSGPFEDTAALMKSLDLIITADTALGHLAGALDVPAWVAVPLSPDWRWLLDRDDSPWYPSVRLFRQTRAGQWSDVFERIAEALRARQKAEHSRGSQQTLRAEVSAGELLDKITILEIKSERMTNPGQLENVRAELAALTRTRDERFSAQEQQALAPVVAELKQVNEALWDIEDAIRVCERRSEFGERFIELARSVYRRNDQRATLKKQINQQLGSALLEEKSYQKYD